MGAKLGLPGGVDDDFVNELLGLLQVHRVDFTTFFRGLSSAPRRELTPELDAWAQRWLSRNPDADAMDRVNPAYIPRNHLVEEALAAATSGDLQPVHTLVDVLRRPYEERPGLEAYAQPAPPSFASYQTFCGT
jgi:uncharacterized protein YdiU (UPF0061 family)